MSNLEASAESRMTAPRASRRWLNWLLLIAIFGSGVVIGALVAVRVVRLQVASVLAHPEQIPDRVVPILRMRLDLDDQQVEQVTAIVKQRHAALEDLRAEFSPRVAVELKQLRTEVDAVLKPEQRVHWDLWCRRIEAHLPTNKASQ